MLQKISSQNFLKKAVTITWKDGSTSPYGERKTNLSTIVQTIYRGILGLGFFIVILEARQKRREKLSETPIKKKIR